MSASDAGGLSSMTGFGRADATLDGWRVRVEFRGVNHRGLDVRVHTPSALRWLEQTVLAAVAEKVHRGRVEVRVDLELAGEGADERFDRIDEKRFALVAGQLKALARANELSLKMSDVLLYRDFFERSTDEVFSEQREAELLPAVTAALVQFVESRRSEGQGIGADLEGHLQRLARCLESVETLRASDSEALKSRVEERLRQTLKDFEVDNVDEARVAQELAFFIDKGDISEELQRAHSHVQRLSAVIASGGGEALGKKIDFYLQELIRETNTMGSKSQHAGLTDLVIEMKSLIEKMREQAANVE